MRYSPEHKQETHERIVRAASRHFRGRGARGIAIADLMKKLDLTHGGFYRHFGSKEQLLVEAVTEALEETAGRFKDAVVKGQAGCELRLIIEEYLSPEHCANAAEGCPIAALATEIPHYPRAVRAKIDRAVREHFKGIARFLPGATESERELDCVLLFTGMAGVLAVARVTADPEQRKAILQRAREFYTSAFCR
jgi:TetR/AcrR family transcriptional repressor of nem operon